MHPIDWNWSERVDCGGPLSLSSPSPVPKPYFPTAAANPFPPFQLAPSTSRSAAHLKPAMNASAGRKRSRDESSFADEWDSSDMSRNSASPPKHPGYSRTNSGYPADPTSSVFAEELSERLRSSSVAENGRPKMESRKSMKIGRGSPDANFPATFAHARSTSDLNHDAAALALGVGWSIVPESLAAAVRGWTTFIESRFPLSSVKFEWAKNSEPKAYLVGAVNKIGRSPGYYLFQDDLQQARLVAKSWSNTLDNLRAGNWEGEEILLARDPSAIAVEVRGMEMASAEPYVEVGMSGDNASAFQANGVQSMAIDGFDGSSQMLNGVQHMGHPIPIAQAQSVGMDLD